MTTASDGTASGPTGGLLAPFGLIRLREDRQLAGVCAALGRASGTDPLLWRAGLGVLVVFAGSGLLLYVLGWLFFPTEGDEVSAVGSLVRRRRSSTAVVATLALLATAVTLAVIVLMNPATYPIVSLGAAMMLLAALSKNRPPPEPVAEPEPTQPDDTAYRTPFAPQGPYARTRELPAAVAAPEPVTVELTAAENTVEPTAAEDTVEPTAAEDTVELPAAAPPERSADSDTSPGPPVWSAPAPATSSTLERRRDSGVLNLVGFSLVGLAMGVMLIVALSGVSVPLMAFEGVALLIVGLVVMIGTWWGRARLLIAFGVVLSMVICVHYLAFGERLDGPFNTSVVASTVEDIPDNWSIQMFEADLNLRGVAFADSDPVELGVLVQGGGGRIFVPQEVDLYISVDVTGGEVQLVEGTDVTAAAGMRAGSVLTSDGPDGPGGGELRIDITVEFGYLEVIRE